MYTTQPFTETEWHRKEVQISQEMPESPITKYASFLLGVLLSLFPFQLSFSLSLSLLASYLSVLHFFLFSLTSSDAFPKHTLTMAKLSSTVECSAFENNRTHCSKSWFTESDEKGNVSDCSMPSGIYMECTKPTPQLELRRERGAWILTSEKQHELQCWISLPVQPGVCIFAGFLHNLWKLGLLRRCVS